LKDAFPALVWVAFEVDVWLQTEQVRLHLNTQSRLIRKNQEISVTFEMLPFRIINAVNEKTKYAWQKIHAPKA
jgi:hypothetical protein